MNTPTHEAVAHRAHQLWQDSGCVEGRDLENWIEAEQQVSADHSPRSPALAHVPGASPAEHAREEIATGQKHEARAAMTPRKTALHAKPPETGKPLWSQPHSR